VARTKPKKPKVALTACAKDVLAIVAEYAAVREQSTALLADMLEEVGQAGPAGRARGQEVAYTCSCMTKCLPLAIASQAGWLVLCPPAGAGRTCGSTSGRTSRSPVHPPPARCGSGSPSRGRRTPALPRNTILA
jgi:hypothetical protein